LNTISRARNYPKPGRFNTSKDLNLTLKGRELQVPIVSGLKTPDEEEEP
jgi:hypothetical protein